MQSRGLCKAGARAAEEDDRLVTFEIEAAEALAGLSRTSAVRGDAAVERPGEAPVKDPMVNSSCRRRQSQGQADQQFCANISTMDKTAFETEETVRILPSQLCSTDYQSHSASKPSQILTEAEKEARRLRRVLSNRESARQTIRRRQAMHQELTRKVAHLLEENENLKKEKECAVEEYNSIKGRNEFLKLRIDDIKKAEPREMEEEPIKSSQAEIATSSTMSTPIFLYNQSSLVPFFWPSVVPSSNVIQLQYMSHSDVLNSSQFHIQDNGIPLLHQGQETSSGCNGLGNPWFILPVPCLLPFFSRSTTLKSHPDANKGRNETPSSHQCSISSSADALFLEDNHQLLSSSSMKMDVSSSARTMSTRNVHGAGFAFPANGGDCCTWHHPKATLLVPEMCIQTVENVGPAKKALQDDICDVNASECITRSSTKNKIQEPIIRGREKSENVFIATNARRKRKELMKLKGARCDNARTHNTNY